MKPKTRFATITLAPAIDSVAEAVPVLTPGAIHRLKDSAPVAGGKGVNVAKLLARRGCAVAAGGFLGEDNADIVERALAKAGIEDRFIRVAGETRRNIMLVDGRGEYKLNRDAFPEMPYRKQRVEDAVKAAIVGGRASPRAAQLTRAVRLGEDAFALPDVVIFSGSLPARFPANAYAAVIPWVKRQGCAVVLDTSGKALALAVKSHPDIIKPNRREAESLLGKVLDTPVAMRKACETLMRHHEVAIISDGQHGAYFASQGKVWYAISPPVTVRDTTAAGDMLLAEFCYRYFPRRILTEDAIRYAVAAGSAATECLGSACPPLARIKELVRCSTFDVRCWTFP